MWKQRAPLAIFGGVVALAIALGVRSRLAAEDHDRPTAASVERVEIALTLDLAARSGCDEIFDVALYEHPGVELVTWDSRRSSCLGRHVVVKYLPSRIRRAALLERIERHAVSMKVDP